MNPGPWGPNKEGSLRASPPRRVKSALASITGAKTKQTETLRSRPARNNLAPGRSGLNAGRRAAAGAGPGCRAPEGRSLRADSGRPGRRPGTCRPHTKGRGSRALPPARCRERALPPAQRKWRRPPGLPGPEAALARPPPPQAPRPSSRRGPALSRAATAYRQLGAASARARAGPRTGPWRRWAAAAGSTAGGGGSGGDGGSGEAAGRRRPGRRQSPEGGPGKPPIGARLALAAPESYAREGRGR